jgi:hypothetical protein
LEILPMTTLHRSPEINPQLLGAPSPATRKARLMRKLAEDANFLSQVIDLLRQVNRLRPSERYEEHRGEHDHLRLIETGRINEAWNLMANYGVNEP